MEQLLASKNLATAFYCYAETTAVLVICRVIGLPVGWPQALETLAAASIALLYLLSVGNHMSVRYPIASNPDRVSRSGASHGVRAAAQFFLFPLSLGPLLAAFFARYVTGQPQSFWTLAAGAAIGGVVIYSLTFRYAAAYGLREREAMLGALSAGQGPLAAE